MNLTKNIKKYFVLIVLFMALSASAAVFAYAPDAVTKYNQGIDYSSRGDYDSAIESFKEALIIDPTFADAYYNLGSLYEFQKKDNDALDAFVQLIKRNPNDNEAAYKIAYIYYRKANYSSALSYLSHVPVTSSKYKDAQTLKKIVTQKLDQANGNSFASTGSPGSKSIIKGFQGPTGITQDKNGNLYVANFGDNSIIKISPSGEKKLVKKGVAINGPIGLAVDKFNNLYVACYNSNKVLKISPNGTVIELLSTVKKPYYLYIDSQGGLLISEQGTNTIIRYKLY